MNRTVLRAAPRVWKLSVLIQLEAVRDCYHNLVKTEVAHRERQDTANERARAGTHEGALTCGCCSEGKRGKEGRERETEELAVCLTETGLVASSCE